MVAMVVIKCPETDREISTGIVTDLAQVGLANGEKIEGPDAEVALAPHDGVEVSPSTTH